MFRSNTSFPFLAIARRRGEDYGRVIRYAESIWDAWKEPRDGPTCREIYQAVLAERARRNNPG